MTTNKVFGIVAKELGFNGSGITRFIEYPTYYLLINHQKSAYSKSFYLNVGIVDKELLSQHLDGEDIAGAFKARDPTAPIHVDFRIERCPTMPVDLAASMECCVTEERMADLKEILCDALQRLMAFMEKNHDRKTIRKLSDAKQLSAMLLKEV